MARTDYRKVYEQFYNIKWDRKLYEIHHIDHNRENNDIKNLILLPRELHRKLHSAQATYIPFYSDRNFLDVVREIEYDHCYGLTSFLESEMIGLFDALREVVYWGYLKSVDYQSGIGYFGIYPEFINTEGIWSVK